MTICPEKQKNIILGNMRTTTRNNISFRIAGSAFCSVLTNLALIFLFVCLPFV
jgi:hypothetical protein